MQDTSCLATSPDTHSITFSQGHLIVSALVLSDNHHTARELPSNILQHTDDMPYIAPWNILEDLQMLLMKDATKEWCTAVDMKLNGSNTPILNGNPTAKSLPIAVLCSVQPIQIVGGAEYLGLHFHIQIRLACTKTVEKRFGSAWANTIKEEMISYTLMLHLHPSCLYPSSCLGLKVANFMKD